jgi:hypothetical protein
MCLRLGVKVYIRAVLDWLKAQSVNMAMKLRIIWEAENNFTSSCHLVKNDRAY